MRRELVPVLRNVLAGWQKHHDSRLAAALAFYAVFSLAPLLLLIIAAVGLFLGANHAQNAVRRQVSGIIGPRGSSAVSMLLSGFLGHERGRYTLFLAGSLVVVYAAGLFLQLQNALDDIWEVPQTVKGGLVKTVMFRAHVLLMIGMLALLAMAAFAGADALSRLAHAATPSHAAAHRAVELGSIALNVAALALFLTMTYRVLPRIDVGWRNAVIGGGVTTVTLVLGELGLSLYFAHAHPGARYGALAAFVIVLLWVHYSAVLLLFGAELTRALEGAETFT